jgi:FkbM family methyltransferase
MIKKLLIRFLPARLLSSLKKHYYARRVKTFWENDIGPIKYLVNPGDAAIDIGANVGWYTRILCQLVAQHGKVYAIEPIPQTFELLSSVIQQLHLSNVELINCAISDTEGSAVMEIPLYESNGIENYYMARLCVSKDPTNSLQKKVNLRTLDSLFSEHPKNIIFIKCDVEGHELSVIRGASHLITQCKPAWLLEISGNPDDEGSPAEHVFRSLAAYGYAPYWFDGQKLRKRITADTSTNYFFLQPSHAARLNVLIL